MTDIIEEATQEPTQEISQEVAATPSQEEKSFIEMIQDPELKGSRSLANFKDLDGLAKSYINLEKKLGAPKEVEKYEPEAYKYDLPEDYTANNDIIATIKDKAIELGVKPEAFKALVETFAGKEKEAMEALKSSSREEYQTQLDEETKYLKEKTKLNPNEIIEKSRSAWGSFADPRYKDVFNNLDQGTQLVVADLLNNISSKISEGSIGKQQTNMLTKSEAQNKLDAIYSDPNHKYFTGDSKERQEIGAEIARLSSLA